MRRRGRGERRVRVGVDQGLNVREVGAPQLKPNRGGKDRVTWEVRCYRGKGERVGGRRERRYCKEGGEREEGAVTYMKEEGRERGGEGGAL